MTAAAVDESTVVTQSRVGKVPVKVPKGVEIKVAGRKVTVKGPKGQLERELPAGLKIELKDQELTIEPAPGAGRQGRQFQGLSRALIASMVTGTSTGFALSLDLVGVGYRAELKGSDLHLALGLSHQVKHAVHPAVTVRIETIDEGGIKRPRVHLSSHDKEALGQTAARIRSYRPPEPYKGKGVRYTGEKLREKAGKTGAKK
jgi:large subunit ribosomal protein L6